MANFNVIIPSNGGFLSNTPVQFGTALERPVELEGDWEVALTSLYTGSPISLLNNSNSYCFITVDHNGKKGVYHIPFKTLNNLGNYDTSLTFYDLCLTDRIIDPFSKTKRFVTGVTPQLFPIKFFCWDDRSNPAKFVLVVVRVYKAPNGGMSAHDWNFMNKRIMSVEVGGHILTLLGCKYPSIKWSEPFERSNPTNQQDFPYIFGYCKSLPFLSHYKLECNIVQTKLSDNKLFEAAIDYPTSRVPVLIYHPVSVSTLNEISLKLSGNKGEQIKLYRYNCSNT